MRHFIEECKITKTWFEKIENNYKEKIKKICNDELDMEKANILVTFWKKKKKIEKQEERNKGLRIS